MSQVVESDVWQLFALTRTRRKSSSRLAGSTGVPMRVVNTKPVSCHAEPAIRRSCSWRVR